MKLPKRIEDTLKERKKIYKRYIKEKLQTEILEELKEKIIHQNVKPLKMSQLVEIIQAKNKRELKKLIKDYLNIPI